MLMSRTRFKTTILVVFKETKGGSEPERRKEKRGIKRK